MNQTVHKRSDLAVKRLVCLLLVIASLFTPLTSAFTPGNGFGLATVAQAGYYEYAYYPKCAASQTSLVNALKSVGVDSSYSYRKYTIAPLNGYTSASYSGTAAQNTQLLNLLKQGKLVKSKKWVDTPSGVTYYPKCASWHTSFVDALKSIGVDSSLSNRKSIAALNGYSNYSGTAAQNTALLNLLKQGKLIKSKGSSKADSTLKIGSGNYNPGSLTEGQSYSISGSITSNY